MTMIEEIPVAHHHHPSHAHYRRSRILYTSGVIVFATIAIVCFSLALNYRAPETTNEGPKNYVLMIADGFGPAHMTLTRAVSGVPSLYMERELRGTVRTRSSNSWVTDSAAGATAYACAKKSYNAAIAVDPEKTPIGTVAEAAKRKGYVVGIVTTARITHATPASFTAHVDHRDLENYIGSQQLRPGFDLLLGGGKKIYEQPTFLPNGSLSQETILHEAIRRGYNFVEDEASLNEAQLPLLGLFSPSHMAFEIDRQAINAKLGEGNGQPSLRAMTKRALELLSNKAKATGAPGFFLMVEGGRIDHAAHANDGASIAPEVMAYNDAVEEVTRFSSEDGGATRLISVADHETGGLTLGRSTTEVEPSNAFPIVEGNMSVPYPYLWRPDVLKRVSKSTEVMAQELEGSAGTIDFDAYYAEATGITSLHPYEEKKIRPIVNALQQCHSSCSKLKWLAIDSLGWPVANRAQIMFTTHGHTGVDINLYAFGKAIDDITANMDNTEVGQAMINHFGLNETMYEVTADLNDVKSPYYVNRAAWDVAREYAGRD